MPSCVPAREGVHCVCGTVGKEMQVRLSNWSSLPGSSSDHCVPRRDFRRFAKVYKLTWLVAHESCGYSCEFFVAKSQVSADTRHWVGVEPATSKP